MIVEDKLMKYVLFKKRTEKEVRQKCKQLNYNDEYIDEIIDYLKDAEYINDELYVKKYIQNVVKLKKCSIFEIKMDLCRRGIDNDLIDCNIDETLDDYELESAIDLARKKFRSDGDINKVKKYLINKGYSHSNITKAIDNIEDLVDN